MSERMTLLRLGGVEGAKARVIDAGLVSQDPAHRETALAGLVAIARQFRAAGGRWTASEWAALEPIEREACVRAAREEDAQADRRLAALVGLAQRFGGAEEMASEFDGGALLEQHAVDTVLDAAHSAAVERARRGGS